MLLRAPSYTTMTARLCGAAIRSGCQKWFLKFTAASTMTVLDQKREHRGAPLFLRMDNGPEFIADTLRDWCREQNIQANYCDPDSPWQNRCIESFNSRLGDELLTRRVFDSMWEIRFMLEEHRNNYNHYLPHSALAYMTRVEFATKWWTENRVLAS